MIFAALVAMSGAVAIGAWNIGDRHMYPILAILPIYLFARVARYGMNREWLARFAVACLVALVLFPAIRSAMMSVPAFSRGGQFGTLQPFEALAADLAQRGIVDGTLVTPDIKIGGNLRAFNSELRIVSPDSHRAFPAPRRAADDRSCVLVWAEHDDRGPDLSDGLPRERIEVRSAPSAIRQSVTGTWWLVRLDPQSQQCRGWVGDAANHAN
jgi:hypothetical protein